MRVLVTGGLGFLGRAVVATLAEQGDDVTAMTSRHIDTSVPGAQRVCTADVRDVAKLTARVAEIRPNAICHLAALTSGRESFTRPVDYYEVNVAGTINLLRAVETIATADPIKLAFVSTNAVYGPGGSDAVSEYAPVNPGNPYAASKLAAEEIVRSYARVDRVGAVILRCFNIAGATADGYGDPDKTRIISAALQAARGDIPHVTVNGDGSAVREFTHVLDVAEAIRQALNAVEPGSEEVFNVGTGKGISMIDVVRSAERVTGTSISTVHRPAAQEAHTLIANPAKIREQLGWKPERSTIDRIIHDAWNAIHDLDLS